MDDDRDAGNDSRGDGDGGGGDVIGDIAGGMCTVSSSARDLTASDTATGERLLAAGICVPWLPTACAVGRAAIRTTSTIAEPAREVLRLVLTSIFAQAMLESQSEVLVL